MCILDEIHAKRDEIYAVARKHKAERLWVFAYFGRKVDIVSDRGLSPYIGKFMRKEALPI